MTRRALDEVIQNYITTELSLTDVLKLKGVYIHFGSWSLWSFKKDQLKIHVDHCASFL